MSDLSTLETRTAAASAPAALPGMRRCHLLSYAVSAPVLTVAAGFGVAESAHAALVPPLPLTPPDTVDDYDMADSIAQTSLPTMPLVEVTVNTDGRITLDLPRLESGQGIATACTMMLADDSTCRCRRST